MIREVIRYRNDQVLIKDCEHGYYYGYVDNLHNIYLLLYLNNEYSWINIDKCTNINNPPTTNKGYQTLKEALSGPDTCFTIFQTVTFPDLITLLIDKAYDYDKGD